MATAESYVYAVKDCRFTFGGGQLNVSGFSLILAQNGIPRLRLGIDPCHFVGAPVEPAKVVTMSAFIKLYNNVQNLTQSAKQRKCGFTFIAESAGGDRQKLELKDWILTAAGFSGFGASGTLQMTLELQHPAVLANESTVNLFGFRISRKPPASIAGSNLYDGICRCMAEYLKLASPGKITQDTKQDPQYKLLVQRYSDALDAFKRHYKAGKGLTWPKKPFGALATYIPRTMWDYVTGMDNQTVWDWLAHSVISDFHASILPTYWDNALEIVPYEPWGDPQVTLIDTDIAEYTLPPSDPAPAAGAYCLINQPQLMMGTWLEDKGGMGKMISDAALWAEKDLPGAIRGFQLPAWMWQLLNYAGSAAGSQGSSLDPADRMNLPSNSGTSKEGMGKSSLTSLTELRTAAKDMAKQIFTEDYRRSMEIAVKCRLLLKSENSQLPNQAVAPGYVYQLRGEGGILLKFFATQVVHTVDCQAKTAYTQVIGSYLRQNPGPKGVEAIPGGRQKNLLYG